MNKEEFMLALRGYLAGMPKADLERTLQYYREMIDDRMEDGMSETQAVADVGDPAELAASILLECQRKNSWAPFLENGFRSGVRKMFFNFKERL